MNSRIRQAALRIALIQEEFSEQEILKAVELLGGNQKPSTALLDYFGGRHVGGGARRSPRQKTKAETDERFSQVLLELEKVEPAKYRVLSELNVLLRKEEVLSDIRNIRRLGEGLDENFPLRGSRKTLIDRMIITLAERPIDEIQSFVKRVMGISRSKDDEYQRLAAFIIEGKNS
jgi:hypothetical protein